MAFNILEFLKSKSGLEALLNLTRTAEQTQDNLSDAIFYAAQMQWEEAVTNLEKELETNQDISTRYLYARILQKTDREKGNKEIEAVIKEIIDQEGVEEEVDLESKNKIYKSRNKILEREIIIKQGDNLEQELATARLLKERFRQIPNLDTYEPITVIGNYYVMEREPHPTFSEVADKYEDEKTRNHLESLVPILAGIHLATRRIETPKKERDLEESIKASLQRCTDLETYRIIASNLNPLIKAQENIVRVVKKDPHPWNFLVDEDYYNPDTRTHGRYIIVDTEITEPIPITTEWAVLLFHRRLFEEDDNKKKDAILREQIIPTNIGAKLIPDEERKYLLATYSSVITRTLELLPRLATRKDKNKYCIDMLESCLFCLSRIEEEFELNYKRSKREYDNLRIGLEILLSGIK